MKKILVCLLMIASFASCTPKEENKAVDSVQDEKTER